MKNDTFLRKYNIIDKKLFIFQTKIIHIINPHL